MTPPSLPVRAEDAAGALEAVLRAIGPAAVAVSGGVDSLTLATFAHRLLPATVTMFHAVSPAVPAEATERTRELAAREGWTLQVIGAGEFEDPDYLRNPVDRCFHCKRNLYGAIRPHTVAQILSGTNRDDLGEYRPGLEAARAESVRHPFVEAGMDKAAVRALARSLGLPEVASLPSSPCLASRVETGIAIDPEELARIHQAETLVRARLAGATDVRCRVRARGVVVELDAAALAALDPTARETLAQAVGALFPGRAGATLEPYRVGSAFLHTIRLERK